ncbi:MAG: hypothetical protein IID37_10980, partial [Planctomycetes bacterium]|nr:hypothetical protein [Planctomycetota bacterium]
MKRQRDIGPTHIHGLTARDVKEAPQFAEIAGDVVSRIAGAVFVAHNACFDMRFLQAELRRAGYDMPQIPYVDTMRLARKADPGIPSRKLEELCKYFHISYEEAHCAHADARATATLLTMCVTSLGGSNELSLSDLGVRGETVENLLWPQVPVSGKSVTRSGAIGIRKAEDSYIARLVAKLPIIIHVTHDIEEYLALLDRVLEDRRVTAEEADGLLSLASELGLSREEVLRAHRTYLRDLLRLAWQDRVVTEAEQDDLEEVRSLLDVPIADYRHLFEDVKNETASGRASTCSSIDRTREIEGKSICFTGKLTSRINGHLADRSYAEQVAAERGMVIRSRCTKKLDYLVSGDPDSLSTKAKKARDY